MYSDNYNSFNKNLQPLLNKKINHNPTIKYFVVSDNYDLYVPQNGKAIITNNSQSLFFNELTTIEYWDICQELYDDLFNHTGIKFPIVNKAEVQKFVDDQSLLINLPIERIKASMCYYGWESIETFIMCQLILRSIDYMEEGIDEDTNWYDVTAKTNFYILDKHGKKQLVIITNLPLISWFKATNRLRTTNIPYYKYLEVTSYQDRSRIVNWFKK